MFSKILIFTVFIGIRVLTFWHVQSYYRIVFRRVSREAKRTVYISEFYFMFIKKRQHFRFLSSHKSDYCTVRKTHISRNPNLFIVWHCLSWQHLLLFSSYIVLQSTLGIERVVRKVHWRRPALETHIGLVTPLARGHSIRSLIYFLDCRLQVFES